MSESFEKWKRDIDDRAFEVVEPTESEINSAVYDAAAQMGDAESIKTGERPIAATIEQLEAEGWKYRGPVSGGEVFEAVAQDGKEIKIVGTGTERFIFERGEERREGGDHPQISPT